MNTWIFFVLTWHTLRALLRSALRDDIDVAFDHGEGDLCPSQFFALDTIILSRKENRICSNQWM